jgi:hypothetical protein
LGGGRKRKALRRRPKALAAPKALLAPPDPLPLADVVAPNSSSSSSTSSSSSSGFELGGRSKVSKWLALPAGGPLVKLDRYKAKGKRLYFRWICQCPAHGASCQKKRTTQHSKVHGALEPLGYLAAWAADGPDISQEDHQQRGYPVDAEDVARWVAQFGSDANDVLALLDD